MDVTPDRVDGWRMKFGKLSHSACDYPNNYTRIVPEGVKMVATSIGIREFDTDSVEAARERRLDAAKYLDDWGVDCIVAGGGPTHAVAGHEAEQEAIADIDAQVDAPFTTSLEAQVDALRELDAESILLVTPFPDDREREQVAYFEGRGFEVVGSGGPVATGSSSARKLHRSTSYQAATELDGKVAEPYDVLFIAGSPFGSIEYVERLERDIGKPVVISAAAQSWKAFQLGGISPALPDAGTLLAEHC
jgi:maleate isomerase